MAELSETEQQKLESAGSMLTQEWQAHSRDQPVMRTSYYSLIASWDPVAEIAALEMLGEGIRPFPLKAEISSL